LCNQICGIALERSGIEVDSLAKIIRRAHPYSEIGNDELAGLLKFMDRQRLIGFDGKKVMASQRTRMYYYEHLSVIPDTKRFIVKNSVDNRIISSLDEKFVSANIEEGSVFIVKGLPWKVISIDEQSISVEPSEHLDAAIPDWTGEDIPVSCAVAMQAKRIILDAKIAERSGCMSGETFDRVLDFAGRQAKLYRAENEALIERVEDYLIFHT